MVNTHPRRITMQQRRVFKNRADTSAQARRDRRIAYVFWFRTGQVIGFLGVILTSYLVCWLVDTVLSGIPNP